MKIETDLEKAYWIARSYKCTDYCNKRAHDLVDIVESVCEQRDSLKDAAAKAVEDATRWLHAQRCKCEAQGVWYEDPRCERERFAARAKAKEETK